MKNTIKAIDYKNPPRVHLYYTNKNKLFRESTSILSKDKNLPENKKEINRCLALLNKIRADYVNEHPNENPSVNYMRIKWNENKLNSSGEVKDDEFELLFDAFMREKRNDPKNLTNGTLKIYGQTFKNLVLKFIEEYNISFRIVDEVFLKKYIDFLLKCTCKKTDVGFSNTYITQQLRSMKTFLRICADLKIVKNNIPEKDWNILFTKYKIVEKNMIAFYESEVLFLLGKRKVQSGWKKKVLDLICFQILTSLRIGDVKKINKSFFNEHQRDRMHFTSEKTNGFFNNGLLPVALDILEENNYNLNYYSLPWYDEALKRILKEYVPECASFGEYIEQTTTVRGVQSVKHLQRYECIASHSGRRTFISMAFENGATEADVREYSKHSENSTAINRYKKVVKRKNLSKIIEDSLNNRESNEEKLLQKIKELEEKIENNSK